MLGVGESLLQTLLHLLSPNKNFQPINCRCTCTNSFQGAKRLICHRICTLRSTGLTLSCPLAVARCSRFTNPPAVAGLLTAPHFTKPQPSTPHLIPPVDPVTSTPPRRTATVSPHAPTPSAGDYHAHNQSSSARMVLIEALPDDGWAAKTAWLDPHALASQ